MNHPEDFDPASFAPPPLPEGTWKIRSIALDLSGRCNLACRYCAESATLPKRPPMPVATLAQAWEWFRQVRPASAWSVHLGSGEPLLALPLLRRLDEMVKADLKDDGAIPVFVTTNGTLLDHAAADWLAGSGWEVKISFDGPRSVHDRWRVAPGGAGTFDVVEDAARSLARRLGDRLILIAVLCRGTDPSEVFEAITATGARRMDFNPVASTDPDVRLDGSDLVRYREFISEFARRWRDGEVSSRPVPARFARFVVRAMGYEGSRVGCGAGRDYVAAGPDGALYPCLRFIGLPRYEIGRLPEGIDESAALAFQRGPGRAYDLRERCRTCWAAPFCAGPCFASAEMFAIDQHCEIFRAEAAAAIWLVRELQHKDPARLLPFLTG